MKYTLDDGKTINIPDKEIEKSMSLLGLTQDEAVSMWLEDNELEFNQEQEELQKKASKVKIQHGAGDKTKRKQSKPRTHINCDEKIELFNYITEQLKSYIINKTDSKVELIIKEKKLIVTVNNIHFTIDVIKNTDDTYGKVIAKNGVIETWAS